MRQFIASTEDFVRVERTRLSADASAGSNVSLSVENNDGMRTLGGFIVIGTEGSEKAEIQQINLDAVAGTSVRVSALTFAHKAGEPIVVYLYDKRKFYGAMTEDGAYTELTADGSPKLIDVDDPQGTVFEYRGTEGYAYFKATYFNSFTLEETDVDESIAAPGDQNGRYATLYGIRKMAGFTQNPYITDGRIDDKRMQAENEINSSIMLRYALPLTEVPAIITYVCELLAAGYMQYEEYGPEGDGVKKLGEARGILARIADGTQRLLGSDYMELPLAGVGGSMLSGKPDGTEEGTHKRHFSVGQRF